MVAEVAAARRLVNTLQDRSMATKQQSKNSNFDHPSYQQRQPRLPIWLGPLPDKERKQREAQGQRVVP